MTDHDDKFTATDITWLNTEQKSGQSIAKILKGPKPYSDKWPFGKAKKKKAEQDKKSK